jgi:formamidopyrimidine-DNA glycosylase
MPELPEVYTIAKDLKNNIVGSIVKKVLISKSYKVQPENKIFIEAIEGKKVTDVFRIAKNIIIEIEEKNYVQIHLATTGRLLLRDKKEVKDKWTKVIFALKDSESFRFLKFCDMRMFGKVAFLNETGLCELRKKYGIEPIDSGATAKDFERALKSKNTNIKNALLDQKIVSGLGNIYATDALFLAKINPQTKTKDLTNKETESLFKAAKKILNEGIKNRGSTLPDKMYVDIFGKSGSQQNHFKIYMKQKCPICNSKVEYIKLNSRGTYFCPKCQPLKQPIVKGLF